MRSSKFLLVLGLLLALSVAILADTSEEREVNSVEKTGGIVKDETEVVEPQEEGRRCPHGCCRWWHGRCIRCCPRNNAAEIENKEDETEVVEPQEDGRRCRLGCCRWRHGRCIRCCCLRRGRRCIRCCPRNNAAEIENEEDETEAETEVVEPQEDGRRCRLGCCRWRHGRCIRCCCLRRGGRCIRCCPRNNAAEIENKEDETEAETEAVEAQEDGRRCRLGCCRWRHGRCIRCCCLRRGGRCIRCCPRNNAAEIENKEDETEAETEAVEAQEDGRRCRLGCCRWRRGRCIRCCCLRRGGRCIRCCPRNNAAEIENEKDETEVVEIQQGDRLEDKTDVM